MGNGGFVGARTRTRSRVRARNKRCCGGLHKKLGQAGWFSMNKQEPCWVPSLLHMRLGQTHWLQVSSHCRGIHKSCLACCRIAQPIEDVGSTKCNGNSLFKGNLKDLQIVCSLDRASFLVCHVSSGVTTLFCFLGTVRGSFLASWAPSLCPVI